MILAIALRAEAQQVPACLKELAAPLYTPLAKSAHVQGDVVLKFSVDSDGNPLEIQTEGNMLLARGVLRAIEGVRFQRKDCAGRQFAVVYRFAFRKSGKYEPTSVTFLPPSGFSVLASLLPLDVDRSLGDPSSACLKPLADKLVYPHLARQALVQGVVDVVFHLDAAGSVLTTELQGHKLLTGGVQMQASEFRFDVARCGDRVPVTLQFQLKDPQSHDGKTTVVFQEPGVLVVSAQKACPNHRPCR